MLEYFIVYTDNTSTTKKLYTFQVRSFLEGSEKPVKTILPIKKEKNMKKNNLCNKFAHRLREVIV